MKLQHILHSVPAKWTICKPVSAALTINTSQMNAEILENEVKMTLLLVYASICSATKHFTTNFIFPCDRRQKLKLRRQFRGVAVTRQQIKTLTGNDVLFFILSARTPWSLESRQRSGGPNLRGGVGKEDAWNQVL